MKTLYGVVMAALLLAGLLSNAGCNDVVSPIDKRFENPYFAEAIQQQMALMNFTQNFIQDKTASKTLKSINSEELFILLQEALGAYQEEIGQKGLVQQFNQHMQLITRILSSYKKQVSDPEQILDSLLTAQGFSEAQKSWMYGLLNTFKQVLLQNGTLEELRQTLTQFDTNVYNALGEEATPILKASASLYAANHALIYNAGFWLSLLNPQTGKTLDDDPDKKKLASIICGVGFAGYGSIVTYALALGPVSAGTTALVGFAIGAIGAVVCTA